MTEGFVPRYTVRTSPLAPAFDLLAACIAGGSPASPFLFDRAGLGVAAGPRGGGVGEGTTLTDVEGLSTFARSVHMRLRAFGGDRPSPVTAIGQISFRPDGFAWMRVPDRLVRRTEPGRTWLQEVSEDGGDDAPRFAPTRSVLGAPSEPFPSAQVLASPTPEGYAAAVADVVARIDAGLVDKVVLARTMRVAAGRPFDAARLAHRLRAVDPDAYTFITPVGAAALGSAALGSGPPPLLVGASPELLVSRHGRSVRSTPLAGSAPRAGDLEEDRANADALFASAKDRHEHAIVVDAIAEVLGPLCDALTWDPEPVLLETANVWHLATRFEGTLRDPAPNAVELVAALHPTPAVCGTPEIVARATIAELEPFDRGGYAGPVGWLDAEGDGEWAIALRCAELEGDRATLFAGAGIVAGSDPAAEVDETERKFRAFLDSLRWG